MLVLLSVLLPYRAPAALAAPPAADLPERPARLSLPTPGLADAETDAVAELAWRVNAVRERHGAPSLELGDALNASASVRAVEVQDGGPLSHERPEGDLLALLEEEGVDCTLAGEALARVAAPNPSTAVAMAYDLFMGSEAHRDLLLHPGFAHLGVAISQSGRRWLVVQVLTNSQVIVADSACGRPHRRSAHRDGRAPLGSRVGRQAHTAVAGRRDPHAAE